MGLSGEREGPDKAGPRAPPPLVRIGLGEGGGAPLFLPPSLPLPSLLVQLGKGGILLPVGVGLLLLVGVGLPLS